ncbi:BnaC08g41450D [Brassica napus]|uniref:Uncharacterized protein n=2 Tax=Brassica TaxID=3705 RepID=A0A3P6G0L0_BRAOL|nr:unnamed protein product [Brassica napus]CDY15978.1 BnaC08g41450D [Brassica napus]VDD59068.1 unnamed protein product [Brassica oleracea]
MVSISPIHLHSTGTLQLLWVLQPWTFCQLVWKIWPPPNV